MDKRHSEGSRPVNPRRRKPSKAQIFKQAYLPFIIAAIALVLIVVFVVGSISRVVQKNNIEKEASIAASIAAAEEKALLDRQAQALLTEAESMAAQMDYEGAIALLSSFSADLSSYPAITEKISEYQAIWDSLDVWSDPSQVVSLSFNSLITDPERAFSDSTYASAYNKNYVTVDEFSAILQQLYDNGYMLVSLRDLFTVETDENGSSTYTSNTLYLPVGKKPLLLTQTNVNYNIYMVDGDGDKLPDKDGAGFASRLMLDADGKITCEMVDSTGQTVTGAYDLVPILDAFVEEHPDFSYNGAKAVLALTGYNGLFGYRTYSGAENYFGMQAYNDAVADAAAVAAALRENGYEFACYTYDNVAYGSYSATMIQADLNNWIAEALPILGNVDIMVYAQQSDIADAGSLYSGDKYEVLKSSGFRYYLGFCSGGSSWAAVEDDYIRIGRILVNGSNMAYHADWFNGIFNSTQVLDIESRGSIPS